MEAEDNFSDENRESLEQPLEDNHGGRFSDHCWELNKFMQWAVGCDDGNSLHFSMEQKLTTGNDYTFHIWQSIR